MANPELIRNTAEIGRRYWLYALLIPVVIIIADQLSKYGVLGLFDLPHDYCAKPYFVETRDLSPLMDFTMKCNRGVSFSMFSSDSQVVRWILTAFAAVMVIVMLVWLRKSDHKLQKLALALVIGGAIGNGIDRVLYGAVIDFIDFSAIKFNYIFNIADSAITCGVIGLLFHAFFIEGKAERAAKKAAKDSSET